MGPKHLDFDHRQKTATDPSVGDRGFERHSRLLELLGGTMIDGTRVLRFEVTLRPHYRMILYILNDIIKMSSLRADQRRGGYIRHMS